jgi:hypothetical protein
MDFTVNLLKRNDFFYGTWYGTQWRENCAGVSRARCTGVIAIFFEVYQRVFPWPDRDGEHSVNALLQEWGIRSPKESAGSRSAAKATASNFYKIRLR